MAVAQINKSDLNSTQALPNDKLDDFHAEHQRKSHCWRNCCLGILFLIVVSLFSAGWILARSGFDVPVLSKLVYQAPPTPSRMVITTAADSDSLNRVLEQAANSANPTDGTVTLTISEAQLNAAVRGVKYPGINLVLFNNHVEWFSPLKLNQMTLYVTARVGLTVENGHLRINLDEAKIGHLRLPAGILNSVGLVLQKQFVDTNSLIKQIQFEQITITDNNLTLRGKVPDSFRGEPESSSNPQVKNSKR